MKVINLLEYKAKKEEEARIKVEAQAKIVEFKNCKKEDANQRFFELVDICMSQNYPCWSVKWDKFIDENWK